MDFDHLVQHIFNPAALYHEDYAQIWFASEITKKYGQIKPHIRRESFDSGSVSRGLSYPTALEADNVTHRMDMKQVLALEAQSSMNGRGDLNKPEQDGMATKS
ncbi:hypothetical protein FQN55_005575 [Onygenales sp. PD_40]|nr:hypothetical protein FQN55_005575 [Onygenales sp. PD_40]